MRSSPNFLNAKAHENAEPTFHYRGSGTDAALQFASEGQSLVSGLFEVDQVGRHAATRLTSLEGSTRVS
jgi:hypothetical protein